MRRAAQTCDRGKDLLRWISTTAVLGLGVSGSPAAGAQPKDPEPEAPSEPPRDATAEATEPSAQQADRPERDAERNEFPRSASRPGTPLRSYDKHQRAPKVPADDARGLTQKPGWESEDYVLLPMRAVLFPAKLLVDIVFTPIEVMLTGIDRYKLIPRVIDFFYFDEDHTAGFYPTVASETGYGLSYGAKVFNKDVAGHAEELSFEGKFGGRYFQAYEAVFDGDRVGGSRFWLETRTRYEKQPGILFFGYGGEEESTGGSGLGPREANVGTRFQQERFLGVARIGGTLGERGGDLTQVGLFGVYNHRRFAGEQRDFPEPSIEQIYDTSRIRGFDEGVNSIELGLTVVHDTRDHELASSGSYLEVLGGAVLPADGYRYWHFGGELTGFIDLYRETRVLALRAALEGVAGHEDEIPFVELPRLGGVHDLRGYLTDRFRDKLSAVATAEYRYPIHQLLSGKLFVDSGNVGRDFDALFASPFDDWKVGAGGGFLIHTEEDVLLSIDLAYGDQFTFFVTTAPLEFFHKRERQL